MTATNFHERGGPLLTCHTWDTLLYEPNTRRTIHGTGAHCAAAACVAPFRLGGRQVGHFNMPIQRSLCSYATSHTPSDPQMNGRITS